MRKDIFRKGIVLGIIFLFVGAIVVPNVISNTTSFGNMLYVGGNGPGNYTAIQDAVDAASEGDTIFVYNGIYHENVVVDESISLIGEDKDITIIDGGEKKDVIYVSADSVSIMGFTIENSGNEWYDSGIDIRSNHNTISDNNLGPNNAFGIYVESSCNNIIEKNYITSNDDGIHLSCSDNNTITGNTITNNFYDGICITNHTSYTDIFNNHLESNRRGIHINIYSHNNNISSLNVILNNINFGVLVQGYSYENNIVNNRITGSAKCGIKLDKGNNNVISKNHIENCAISINLDFSPKNTITKNNLMAFEIGHVRLNARLVNSFGNRWHGNFWSDYPKDIPPKVIRGTWFVGMLIMIPDWDFDWDPQLIPYDYT